MLIAASTRSRTIDSDVAADVADLGELGGLDLDERRAGQPGEPAGDLGLPDAGGADQDDVVRRDLVPDVVRRLGPAPAVPERDGDRLLGGLLADDVAVELGHDLARAAAPPARGAALGGVRRAVGGDGWSGGVGHVTSRLGSSRMVMCRLV